MDTNTKLNPVKLLPMLLLGVVTIWWSVFPPTIGYSDNGTRVYRSVYNHEDLVSSPSIDSLKYRLDKCQQRVSSKIERIQLQQDTLEKQQGEIFMAECDYWTNYYNSHPELVLHFWQ